MALDEQRRLKNALLELEREEECTFKPMLITKNHEVRSKLFDFSQSKQFTQHISSNMCNFAPSVFPIDSLFSENTMVSDTFSPKNVKNNSKMGKESKKKRGKSQGKSMKTNVSVQKFVDRLNKVREGKEMEVVEMDKRVGSGKNWTYR
jgi:hypothetical protein